MSTSTSTADRVLAELARFELKPEGLNKYRSNSPLRPGSNSHAFCVRIEGPEHGAYFDQVSGESGSLYQLADKLGVRDEAPRHQAQARRLVTAYDYVDEQGQLLYQACRFEPGKDGKAKDFQQRRPDERGGWLWRLDDARRVLYRLPDVLRAAAAGETIYIVEGEKDSDRLGLCGLVATCNVGGAGKWRSEYSDALRGADVVILADNDEPGERHAAQVAAALAGVARKVRQVRLPGLPPKGDVSDWLDQGHTLAELLELAGAAEDAPAPAERLQGLRLIPASDLGQLPPVRWLVPGEVPEAALAVLYGPSGVGKSFVALDYAGRIAQGRPVAYVAGEGASGYHARLSAWRSFHQADVGALGFVFDQVNLLDDRSVDELAAALAPHAPALVVVDTLAQTMIGGDENSSRDMGLYLASCRRLIRELGATVLLVHHTGKNGGAERGSSALRGAADTMIELSNDDGIITLSCSKMKDAPAFASRYLSLKPHGESCVIVPATTRSDPAAPLSAGQVKILEVLGLSIFAEKGAKTSQIAEAAVISQASLFRALSALKDRGYISQGSKGDPYYLTSIGRAALGPEYLLSPDEAHQDAQLSQLSTDSHRLSRENTTDSLSLSHPFRGESESESESDRRDGYQSILGYGDELPFPTVGSDDEDREALAKQGYRVTWKEQHQRWMVRGPSLGDVATTEAEGWAKAAAHAQGESRRV